MPFFVMAILALPKSSKACVLFVIRSHENRVALENLGKLLQTEFEASYELVLRGKFDFTLTKTKHEKW